MIALVWYRTGTGGGCTAERADIPASAGFPHGRYALLTNGDAQAPELGEPCMLGVYVNEEDPEHGDDYLGDGIDGTREVCLEWLAAKIAEPE